MRTAVDRIGSGKARQVNARFAAMASHYLFEDGFLQSGVGLGKGQVEKNWHIGDILSRQINVGFRTWRRDVTHRSEMSLNDPNAT